MFDEYLYGSEITDEDYKLYAIYEATEWAMTFNDMTATAKYLKKFEEIFDKMWAEGECTY